MTGEPFALAVVALDAPFGNRDGLRDVTFSVAPGKRLVVLGPSGSGKTTLLRAVAGLANVTAGRVLVAGRDVTAVAPDQRHAVYLHQTPVLFPHLTVAGNIEFPLRVRGVPRPERARIIAQHLSELHVDMLASRYPHELSGGQRTRVALARATAARPAVLLLDEPLAALDPTLRADTRAAIVAAQQLHGTAVVVVTHDLDDAAELGDEVAVLLDGRVAQRGTPQLLFGTPASLAVARFLGTMHELSGRIEDGALRGDWGLLPLADVRSNALPEAGSCAVAVLPRGAVRIGGDGSVRGTVEATRATPNGPALVVRVGESRIVISVAAQCWQNDAVVSLQVDATHAFFFPSTP